MPAKKKPSAAQLRARKLFAQRARSGAFARKAKRRKNPLPAAVRSGLPASARAQGARRSGAPRRRPVVKKNRLQAPVRYAVHRATRDGQPGQLLGAFPKKDDAVAYGRAIAKSKRCSVLIVGKAR